MIYYYCPGPKNCGVYSQGIRIYNILKEYSSYEISNLPPPKGSSIIYNGPDIYPENIEGNILCILHESPHFNPKTDTFYFNGYPRHSVICDPSLDETEFVHPMMRPLCVSELLPVENTIGSFGFPFPNKGFLKLAEIVKETNYNLKIHAPLPAIIPIDIKKLEFELRNILGDRLEFSSEYKSDTELVSWLSTNILNVFLYDDDLRPFPRERSGCSSVLDFAIPASRPILVSNSIQFRHTSFPTYPEYTIEDCLSLGNSKCISLLNEWHPRKFAKAFDVLIEKYL